MTLLHKVAPEGGQIDMPGGKLYVNLRIINGEVVDIFLTGPTLIVYRGDLVENY